MRVSQINECAFCLDMHWKDARANGETEQRLYGLSAWREAPYYTDRERAALGLTEAVTRLAGGGGVPDEVIAAAEPHFSSEELRRAALLHRGDQLVEPTGDLWPFTRRQLRRRGVLTRRPLPSTASRPAAGQRTATGWSARYSSRSVWKRWPPPSLRPKITNSFARWPAPAGAAGR